MITGKAKEDFEKWYNENIPVPNALIIYNKEDEKSKFNIYPFSMQYGVYVDWFDSVGIKLIDDFDVNEKKFFFWYITNVSRAKLVTFFETRHEARTKAIEKACEIYNEKQNKK